MLALSGIATEATAQAGPLSTDLGRASFAVLTRFAAPVVVGAIAFDFYAPRHLVTYPLTALSVQSRT